jgi:hypothetical protein
MPPSHNDALGVSEAPGAVESDCVRLELSDGLYILGAALVWLAIWWSS